MADIGFSRNQVTSSFNADIRNEFVTLNVPTLRNPNCADDGIVNYDPPGSFNGYPISGSLKEALNQKIISGCGNGATTFIPTTVQTQNCSIPSNNNNQTQVSGPYYIPSASGAAPGSTLPVNVAVVPGGVYGGTNPLGYGSAINLGYANNPPISSVSSIPVNGQNGPVLVNGQNGQVLVNGQNGQVLVNGQNGTVLVNGQTSCVSGAPQDCFNTNPAAKTNFAFFKSPFFDPNSCSAINNYTKGKPTNQLNPIEWINGQGTQTYNPYMYTNLSQATGALPPIMMNSILAAFVPKDQVPDLSKAIKKDSTGIPYVLTTNYVFNKTLILDAHTTYIVKVVFQNEGQLFENFNTAGDSSANDKYVVYFAISPTSSRPLPGFAYMKVGSSTRITFESFLTNRIIFLNFGVLSDDDADSADECATVCSTSICAYASYIFVSENHVASGHSR